MTVSDLHSAVRLNDSSKVSQLIRKSKSDLESRDYLDNTPLLLAIKLGYAEIAILLLNAGASIDYLSENCYPLLDEALLSCREYQVIRQLYGKSKEILLKKWYNKIMPGLITCLEDMINFKFTLHVGLQGNFLLNSLVQFFTPSETYTIWKCGSSIRIDFSIKKINKDMSVKRGNLSLLIRKNRINDLAIFKIDHDKMKCRDMIRSWENPSELDVRMYILGIMENMNNKQRIFGFQLNFEEINLLRSKTLFGYDRVDVINGWNCEGWEAKTKLECHISSKTSNQEKSCSKEEYLRGDLKNVSLSNSSLHTIKRNVKAQIWMTKEVPLRIQHLLSIVQLIGLDNNTNHSHILETFFADHSHVLDHGCPVKTVLPIALGIDFSASILNFDSTCPPMSVFDVPCDYQT